MAEYAEIAAAAIDAALAAVLEHEEELGKLDSVAGDGDHGAGMARGFRGAAAASRKGTAGDLIAAAGMAFANTAGGASGALVGMFMMTAGKTLTDPIDAAKVADALHKGIEAIMKLGKGEAGDKTLLDTLIPFATAYSAAVETGLDIRAAWEHALPAAEAGMKSTTEMIAKRGRSAVLKEKSLGTQDPGATSIYYVLTAVGRTLAEHCP